jgi:hypothetical protein
MTLKAGLARLGQSGLGSILTDWAGTGMKVINPGTGLAVGRRYIPMLPGLAFAATLLGRPDTFRNAGAEYIFKDFCKGTRWNVDGTAIHPNGGAAVFGNASGTVANPVQTLTLAGAAGSFTLFKPAIPANMLIAGVSQIKIEAVVRHSTAAATANLNLRFGTTGGATDPIAAQVPQAATVNQETRFDVVISVGANGTDYNATSTLAPGSQGTAITTDRAASVTLTAPMILSMDISAGTSGDAFKLVWYRATLFQ